MCILSLVESGSSQLCVVAAGISGHPAFIRSERICHHGGSSYTVLFRIHSVFFVPMRFVDVFLGSLLLKKIGATNEVQVMPTRDSGVKIFVFEENHHCVFATEESLPFPAETLVGKTRSSESIPCDPSDDTMFKAQANAQIDALAAELYSEAQARNEESQETPKSTGEVAQHVQAESATDGAYLAVKHTLKTGEASEYITTGSCNLVYKLDRLQIMLILVGAKKCLPATAEEEREQFLALIPLNQD